MKKNSGKIEDIVEQSSKRYNLVWKKYRVNLAYNCSLLEARISYMDMYLSVDFEYRLLGNIWEKCDKEI